MKLSKSFIQLFIIAIAFSLPACEKEESEPIIANPADNSVNLVGEWIFTTYSTSYGQPFTIFDTIEYNGLIIKDSIIVSDSTYLIDFIGFYCDLHQMSLNGIAVGCVRPPGWSPNGEFIAPDSIHFSTYYGGLARGVGYEVHGKRK